jgi:hypothetical protein
VPASSWQAFDLQAAGLSDEVREWAETAVQPYTTLLEAVHATLDPGTSEARGSNKRQDSRGLAGRCAAMTVRSLGLR